MEIVPFEIAQKLKEKEFPQHITDEAYIVDNYGEDEWDIGDRLPIPLIPDYMDDVAAPTISQVLKWLREEKRIEVNACWDNKDAQWIGYASEMDKPDLVGYYTSIDYDSYEQAAIAGINWTLDNLI